MKKVIWIPVEALGSLEGCWTIDHTSGAGDNGFLDCARARFPTAGSHDSTASAVTNILNCFSAGVAKAGSASVKKWANFVGHGNDGIIVTGTGQDVNDITKYVSWFNRSTWGPEMRRLNGSAQIIKLWACHPGTAQDGADLLFDLMQETNAICMGPTGFLTCGSNGLELEANSTWQVATPGQPKPAPIAAPTPHFVLDYPNLELSTQGRPHMLPMQSVISVEIISRRGQRVLLASAQDAMDFLRLVDFTAPFELNGSLAAIPSGTLILTFRDDKGAEHRREFLIYNNRLLQDQTDKKVYYRCSESFGRVFTIPL